MKNLRFLFAAFILNLCSLISFGQVHEHRIKVINLDSSASNYFIIFSEGGSKSVIVSPKRASSGIINSGRKIKANNAYSLSLRKIKFIPEPEMSKVTRPQKLDSVKGLTFICATSKGQVYYIKGKKAPLYMSKDISGLFISKSRL